MESEERHCLGLLIALAGVILVSPDATLLRLLSATGASNLDVIFWKLLFASLFTGTYAVASSGLSHIVRGARSAPAHTAAAVALQAAVNVGFSLALLETTASSALLLIYLNPMWTAAFCWCLLGDEFENRTAVALAGAAVAMSVAFIPGVVLDDDGYVSDDMNECARAPTRRGDCIALATGVGLALYLTVSRSAGTRCPEAPMSAASSCGSALGAIAVLVVGVATSDALPVLPAGRRGRFLGIALADALCIAAMYVAVSIAPRYLPATQVALIFLLEVVFGPLIVFLAFDERPTDYVIVGGALLLCTLAMHELAAAPAPKRGEAAQLIGVSEDAQRGAAEPPA